MIANVDRWFAEAYPESRRPDQLSGKPITDEADLPMYPQAIEPREY
ncbi:MAG: hypothetical protein ACLPQS_11500 [Acidimicrobiales bacterium]